MTAQELNTRLEAVRAELRDAYIDDCYENLKSPAHESASILGRIGRWIDAHDWVPGAIFVALMVGAIVTGCCFRMKARRVADAEAARVHAHRVEHCDCRRVSRGSSERPETAVLKRLPDGRGIPAPESTCLEWVCPVSMEGDR